MQELLVVAPLQIINDSLDIFGVLLSGFTVFVIRDTDVKLDDTIFSAGCVEGNFPIEIIVPDVSNLIGIIDFVDVMGEESVLPVDLNFLEGESHWFIEGAFDWDQI